VKSYAVFICPDDVADPGHTGPYISYDGNANVFGNGNFSTAYNSVRYSVLLNKLNAPAKTVLATEMKGWFYTLTDTNLYDQCPTWNGLPYDYNAGNNNVWGGSGGSVPETGTMHGESTDGGPIVGWHSGGSNVLFTDGHVKWLMPLTISPGWNAATSTSAEVPGNWGTAAGSDVSTFAATFSPV
jgi:prepilin-type processing-associated H-X9-DG protein